MHEHSKKIGNWIVGGRALSWWRPSQVWEASEECRWHGSNPKSCSGIQFPLKEFCCKANFVLVQNQQNDYSFFETCPKAAKQLLIFLNFLKSTKWLLIFFDLFKVSKQLKQSSKKQPSMHCLIHNQQRVDKIIASKEITVIQNQN